jgi:hypothetical protein
LRPSLIAKVIFRRRAVMPHDSADRGKGEAVRMATGANSSTDYQNADKCKSDKPSASNKLPSNRHPMDDPEQSKRFLEAAKTAEADETAEGADKALKSVVKPRKRPE